MRNTDEVLLDLKKLIASKGYIYSLCLILFEDFHFDLNKIHEVDPRSKLSVKECALIIGFLVQEKIDFSIPSSPEQVFGLMEKTYELMEELQFSFNAPMFSKFQEMNERQQKGEKLEDTQQERLNFFVKDAGMVEPMFYAGDGVYDFQYLEYLESKYKYDKEWLIKNRDFEINVTKRIVSQVKECLRGKAKYVLPLNTKKTFPKVAEQVRRKVKGKFSLAQIEETERKMLISTTFYRYIHLFPQPDYMKENNSEGWSKFYANLLDLFTISRLDFENIDHGAIESFFQNFSFIPGCNETYSGPGHFNILNSRPLIKLDGERYFVPIGYLIPEAVYESPFYWMWDDKQYRDILGKHRGDVGEEIAYDLLVKVFGKGNTYRSVTVETKKGRRDTDIDVLCLLGNKALCVQVKSKKLTLTAKRGDFEQLSKDFNGAVQDAYDQGLVSREAILNKRSRLFDNNGDEVSLPKEINDVYIMSLTTENYPSLVHQVQIMLVKDSKAPYPFVLSVFDLELLAHYLSDPYDFLYYVRQRIDLTEYIKADEELVYLGYHLSRKLCRIEGYDWGILENDYGSIIDRNYYPYKTGVSHLLNESDDPILNRWKDPNFDSFINAIKLSGHPKTTDIVFHLLDWSGDSRKNMIEQMAKTKQISQRKGISKSIASPTPPNFGLSYIVLDAANPQALAEKVITYSKLRKYLSKCNAWLGMGSYSHSPNLIDFLVYNDEIWKIDLKLEEEHNETLATMKKTPFTPLQGKKKVGRNDLCPCKSGKKYKRCCAH